MSTSKLVKALTETSPAVASTAVSAGTITGLARYDWITVEADLQGATGGTLDVYVQRKLATNLWRDWIHFTQLAAGGAAVKYSAQPQPDTAIIVVGGGTDAAPGVALAANTSVGGHPGDTLRLVFVAGAGTSAGAAQTVRVMGWKD
jgi:hypothetical protein